MMHYRRKQWKVRVLKIYAGHVAAVATATAGIAVGAIRASNRYQGQAALSKNNQVSEESTYMVFFTLP